MTLREYLHWQGITDAQFAQRIDVDLVSVRRYMRGDRRPRWDVMSRIVAESNGHVTANDFMGEPVKKKVPLRRVA